MAKNKKVEISLEEKLEKALVPVEEQPYKIPNNWVWTRLGEVAVLNNGEIVENEELIYFDVKTLRANMEFEKKNSGRLVEKNDLVILVDGENSGEIFKIPYRGYMGSTFKKLNYKKEQMWEYISIFLRKNKEVFKNNKIGSAIPHLNKTLFKEIEFPLPPLNEQKRIVEKLDFLFDKTKKAKEIIEEIKIDIENRKISILDRAFKGVLTSKWRNENKVSDVKELLKSINDEKIKKWEEDCLQAEKNGNKKPKKPIIREIEDMIIPIEEQPYKIPDSWVWVRLGDIYNLFTGNSIPESEKTTKYINLSNGYKYIATKDVAYNGEINYENGVIIPYNEEKFKVAKANSSLLCIEGGSAGRKAGIVDRDVCFVNKLCCFESNSNLESKIIYYYIKSENFLSLFRESMNGLIGGVSLNNLKRMEFPLPPLEEQQEIVRILDEVLENENKVKELLELEERIDILEKSILNKAFKGELGTQNNSDESAIELLKSIL